MRNVIIIIAMLLCGKVKGQTIADSLKIQLTDSTAIFSVQDVNRFLKYTEDKLYAKDYLIFRNWWIENIEAVKNKYDKIPKPKKKKNAKRLER